MNKINYFKIKNSREKIYNYRIKKILSLLKKYASKTSSLKKINS